MHTGDALDTRDAVEQQFLVGIHVTDDHLELVIGLLPGDQQTFKYLGLQRDPCLEIGEAFRRVTVHRNMYECHQGKAE